MSPSPLISSFVHNYFLIVTIVLRQNLAQEVRISGFGFSFFYGIGYTLRVKMKNDGCNQVTA